MGSEMCIRDSREADDVERGQRRAAHRVHVGQAVGGGDAAEQIRVIHDGRKKVHRLDEGKVGAQTHHARVVARVQADKQVGVPLDGQARQNFLQGRRPDLARSAGAAHARGQSFGGAFALVAGLGHFLISHVFRIPRAKEPQ